MPVKSVPKGHNHVSPYLVVEDVKKLLEFLKKVFNAKEIDRMAMPDGTLSHAEVKIGDSVVMMGAAPAGTPSMQNMIHIYCDKVDLVYQRAIKAGATSIREPADQFYEDRSGGIKDIFGNQWWMSTHIEDVSDKEMVNRALTASKKK